MTGLGDSGDETLNSNTSARFVNVSSGGIALAIAGSRLFCLLTINLHSQAAATDLGVHNGRRTIRTDVDN